MWTVESCKTVFVYWDFRPSVVKCIIMEDSPDNKRPNLDRSNLKVGAFLVYKISGGGRVCETSIGYLNCCNKCVNFMCQQKAIRR